MPRTTDVEGETTTGPTADWWSRLPGEQVSHLEWADLLTISWVPPGETTEYFVLPALGETTGDLLMENWRLRLENAQLGGRLTQLEDRLAALEAAIPQSNVLVLRELTRTDAKAEIAASFAGSEVLSYSELMDRLQLPLELVVDICDELVEEGVIAPDAAGTN